MRSPPSNQLLETDIHTDKLCCYYIEGEVRVTDNTQVDREKTEWAQHKCLDRYTVLHCAYNHIYTLN